MRDVCVVSIGVISFGGFPDKGVKALDQEASSALESPELRFMFSNERIEER